MSWRRVADEIVIFDSRCSAYVALNRTAAFLWPRLAAGATRSELLTLVLDIFDVDAERAARDIDSLLTDLGDRGLLEDPSVAGPD